ncbi:MAG: hypothetical protein R2722_16965 [Tessaracoccus sp.]
MDPLTSIVLIVVFSAVWFYVLYNVVRKAVAGGIRDARESRHIEVKNEGLPDRDRPYREGTSYRDGDGQVTARR